MAINPSVSIVGISESVRFPIGGGAIRTRVYKYTVGTDGPFTVEFDAGTDTNKAVEDALNAEANRIAALRTNS